VKSTSLRSYPAWAPWLFLAAFLLIFFMFTAWPLVQSLVLSFQQTYGPRRTAFVGLANFSFLLHDPLFWKALRNTACFTLGSVLLQIPAALVLALLLNRPGLRGRTLFRLIFFAPSLVGTVFVGVIFYLLFQAHTGIVNQVLHALFPSFDPEFAWMQDHVMSSLILAALWMQAGFGMIYFLAALQNVPAELIEASSLDGAGPWQRFRHIVLPEIRPVAGFVVLLSVISSFQLFELPWVMFNSGGGPDNRGLTIVMYLYENGFIIGDLGYASAVGWVLAVLLMLAAIIQRRLARRQED